MMIIFCNDGCIVTAMGHSISVSNGEIYSYMGHLLSGSGIASYNVSSLDEAVGIIVGMHGGRKL